jgi:hypothetical protein
MIMTMTEVIFRITELEKLFEATCREVEKLENYYGPEEVAERKRLERMAERVARNISTERDYAKRIANPGSQAELDLLVEFGILPPGKFVVLELSEERSSFEYGGLVPLNFDDNDRGGRKTMFRAFKGDPF